RRQAELGWREGLEQEPGRRRRVVDEGERPSSPRPGDVGEAPFFLECPFRLTGVGDRPSRREAAFLEPDHGDVIELEPLRAMRGGERERRVVAPERGESGARLRDGRAERWEVRTSGGPAEEGPGDREPI